MNTKLKLLTRKHKNEQRRNLRNSNSHLGVFYGRNLLLNPKCLIINEKQIEEKLHALIAICRYDGHDLLDEVISLVPQQYNDVDEYGNDLTHRVIRGWFKPYVFDNFKL